MSTLHFGKSHLCFQLSSFFIVLLLTCVATNQAAQHTERPRRRHIPTTNNDPISIKGGNFSKYLLSSAYKKKFAKFPFLYIFNPLNFVSQICLIAFAVCFLQPKLCIQEQCPSFPSFWYQCVNADQTRLLLEKGCTATDVKDESQGAIQVNENYFIAPVSQPASHQIQYLQKTKGFLSAAL